MLSSRGMGAVSPSKMPKGKVVRRKDGDKVDVYAEGGPIWDKARPKKLGASKKLSINQAATARTRAKKSGRPYPNLIDNIAAARSK